MNPQGRYQEPSACSPEANVRGGVLIIVLWSLCLLAIFAVVLGYNVRQKIRFVQRLEERDKLRLIAEAGIKKAIMEIRKDPEVIYSSLSDAWSDNETAFSGVAVGGGTFDVINSYSYEGSVYPETPYGAVDEERKININTARRAILERLFRGALGFDQMQSQELAASIVDWRDGDSMLSIPLGSAEDSDYRGMKYPYEAKDAPFEMLDELLLVNGMTPEILEAIRDYVTIYGSGRVNINTAPKPVLLALGLNGHTADQIIAYRNGEEGIVSSASKGVFAESGPLFPNPTQFVNLSKTEAGNFFMVADLYLTIISNHFMIHSVARLAGKQNTSEALCVVNRNGDILYWRET